MNHSTFDSIVSDFYRAATGAMHWDLALEGVRHAFSARAVNLQTFDASHGQVLSLHTGGPATHEPDLHYIKEFHRIDPMRKHGMSKGPEVVGQWLHSHELFDRTFVEADPYHQDFLAAFDIRHSSCVTLSIDNTILTGLSICLPAARGHMSSDERDLARRLGEHLRDALIAYERVRRLAAQAIAGQALLSAFSYPMVLMDKSRAIAFENPAATIEFERGTQLLRNGSILELGRLRKNLLLTEKMHSLFERGHGASAVIDLRETLADRSIWLHLSLMIPGAVMGVFGQQPHVLATLFDPAQITELDPFALTAMFSLTPSEARVAVQLAKGLTAEQVSVTVGTAVSTVRTQISSIIAKLGVTRTAEVVRILLQGDVLWSANRLAD